MKRILAANRCKMFPLRSTLLVEAEDLEASVHVRQDE